MRGAFIAAVALGLASLGAPVLAGRATTEPVTTVTLGNSGKTADADQGGNGTTTTTTQSSGPPGQINNQENTECNNCTTTKTTNGPGHKN